MSKTKVYPVETDLRKLRQVSQEVNLGDVSLINAIENKMLSVFRELDGKMQGLSAIQVGYAYRAILLRYNKGDTPVVVYNPVVLCGFGNKNSNEGCLSEGNERYIVKRPLLIKVRFYTKYREEVIEWLPYKKARIFMHEINHLNGVLLQDIGVKVEKR